MKPGRLRAVRWTGASIIFQGAMHALNPVKRIGDQIAEAITVHQQAGEKEATVRVGALLEQVGLPTRRMKDYPARAVGRAEAARDDRDGARVLALARDRRRADDRARRDGAGAGAPPDEGAAARPRPVDDLHHPRPLGARRDLRPARDHVRRARSSRRDPPRRCSTRRSTPTPRRSPRRSPRSATSGSAASRSGLGGDPPDPAEHADGVLVPPPVPEGVRRLHRRSSPSCTRRARAGARRACSCRPRSAGAGAGA